MADEGALNRRIREGIPDAGANEAGMSAMGGSVRMPSPDEIAAGGNVVPLRHESTPVEPVQQPESTAAELGPVSPELAMVDPELARAARELLPDGPRPVRVAQAPVAPVAEQAVAVQRPPIRLEPRPEPAPPRRRIRLGLLSSAVGVIALGVLLTLFVVRDDRLGLRAQRTQPVAAVVSPTTGTPTQPGPAATTPANSAPVHATAVPGQTFVWVTSPDAAAYEFQLFQGGERVFQARVDKARLELPGRWREAGRPHALLPGTYRWYVWTISKSTNRQSAKPTVSAKLVVEK